MLSICIHQQSAFFSNPTLIRTLRLLFVFKAGRLQIALPNAGCKSYYYPTCGENVCLGRSVSLPFKTMVVRPVPAAITMMSVSTTSIGNNRNSFCSNNSYNNHNHNNIVMIVIKIPTASRSYVNPINVDVYWISSTGEEEDLVHPCCLF